MTDEKKTSVIGAVLIVTALLAVLFFAMDTRSFQQVDKSVPAIKMSVTVTQFDTGVSNAVDTGNSCLGDYGDSGFGTNVQEAE